MSPLLIKSGFGEGFEMIVSGGAAASGAAHRGVGDWAVMYVPRWAGRGAGRVDGERVTCDRVDGMTGIGFIKYCFLLLSFNV